MKNAELVRGAVYEFAKKIEQNFGVKPDISLDETTRNYSAEHFYNTHKLQWGEKERLAVDMFPKTETVRVARGNNPRLVTPEYVREHNPRIQWSTLGWTKLITRPVADDRDDRDWSTTTLNFCRVRYQIAEHLEHDESNYLAQLDQGSGLITGHFKTSGAFDSRMSKVATAGVLEAMVDVYNGAMERLGREDYFLGQRLTSAQSSQRDYTISIQKQK